MRQGNEVKSALKYAKKIGFTEMLVKIRRMELMELGLVEDENIECCLDVYREQLGFINRKERLREKMEEIISAYIGRNRNNEDDHNETPIVTRSVSYFFST